MQDCLTGEKAYRRTTLLTLPGAALCMGTAMFCYVSVDSGSPWCVQSSGCKKQHPAVSTGSISWWRSQLLYACHGAFLFLLGPAGQPENLGGAPALCPALGKTNNGAHLFLWVCVASSAPRELSWYPLCSLWSVSPAC